MGAPTAEIEAIQAAARRVAPVFSGSRLVALRELRGETQAAVAAAAGITASALSQAERGDTTLSAVNIAKVAQFFKVSPAAFAERREPELEMQPQFRHLRRTSSREQRKAERFVLATSWPRHRQQASSATWSKPDLPEPTSRSPTRSTRNCRSTTSRSKLNALLR